MRYAALVAVAAVAAVLFSLTGADAAKSPTLAYKQVFVTANVANGDVVKIRARCPRGYVLTGGGLAVGANTLVYADSTDARTFEVAAGNFSTLSTAGAAADAFCLRGASGIKITAASLSDGGRSRLVRQALAAQRK